VLGFLISTALSFALPPELALAVGLVLAIYTLGASIGWDFTGLWTNFTINTFGSITGLLKSVSDIFSYINRYKFTDQLKQLQYEQDQWMQDFREQQQKLEDQYYSMDSQSLISPLDLTRETIQPPLEYPEEFYARTQWRDAAAESFAILSNFYEIVLALPTKPGQTNPLYDLNSFLRTS
jgi:hypothetical protein